MGFPHNNSDSPDAAISLVLVVQIASAGAFVFDMALSIFGFYPFPSLWTARALMEMGATLGLMPGGDFRDKLMA